MTGMVTMTDGQYWGIIIMLLVIGGLLLFAYMWHWRKVDQDILKEDKRKLAIWAQQHAQELAEQMFRDYVAGMKIKPVLVNESNMDWGEKDAE